MNFDDYMRKIQYIANVLERNKYVENILNGRELDVIQDFQYICINSAANPKLVNDIIARLAQDGHSAVVVQYVKNISMNMWKDLFDRNEHIKKIFIDNFEYIFNNATILSFREIERFLNDPDTCQLVYNRLSSTIKKLNTYDRASLIVLLKYKNGGVERIKANISIFFQKGEFDISTAYSRILTELSEIPQISKLEILKACADQLEEMLNRETAIDNETNKMLNWIYDAFEETKMTPSDRAEIKKYIDNAILQNFDYILDKSNYDRNTIKLLKQFECTKEKFENNKDLYIEKLNRYNNKMENNTIDISNRTVDNINQKQVEVNIDNIEKSGTNEENIKQIENVAQNEEHIDKTAKDEVYTENIKPDEVDLENIEPIVQSNIINIENNIEYIDQVEQNNCNMDDLSQVEQNEVEAEQIYQTVKDNIDEDSINKIESNEVNINNIIQMNQNEFNLEQIEQQEDDNIEDINQIKQDDIPFENMQQIKSNELDLKQIQSYEEDIDNVNYKETNKEIENEESEDNINVENEIYSNPSCNENTIINSMLNANENDVSQIDNVVAFENNEEVNSETTNVHENLKMHEINLTDINKKEVESLDKSIKKLISSSIEDTDKIIERILKKDNIENQVEEHYNRIVQNINTSKANNTNYTEQIQNNIHTNPMMRYDNNEQNRRATNNKLQEQNSEQSLNNIQKDIKYNKDILSTPNNRIADNNTNQESTALVVYKKKNNNIVKKIWKKFLKLFKLDDSVERIGE